MKKILLAVLLLFVYSDSFAAGTISGGQNQDVKSGANVTFGSVSADSVSINGTPLSVISADDVTTEINITDQIQVKAGGIGTSQVTDDAITPAKILETGDYTVNSLDSNKLTVTATKTDDSDNRGPVFIDVNRTAGSQQTGNIWKEYTVTADLTACCDVADNTVTRWDSATSGGAFGEWTVVGTPKASYGGRFVGEEWNILNRYNNTTDLGTTPETTNTVMFQVVPENSLNLGQYMQRGYNIDAGIAFGHSAAARAVVSGLTNISFDSATKRISSGTTTIGSSFSSGETFTVTGSVSNNGTYTVDAIISTTIISVVEALVDEAAGAAVTITPSDTDAGWPRARTNIPILYDTDSIAPLGHGMYMRGGSTSSYDPVSAISFNDHFQKGIDLRSATFNDTNSPAMQMDNSDSIMWGANYLYGTDAGLYYNGVLSLKNGTNNIGTTDLNIGGTDFSNIFVIDESSGKIGLGTDAPSYVLHISNAAPTFGMTDTDTAIGSFRTTIGTSRNWSFIKPSNGSVAGGTSSFFKFDNLGLDIGTYLQQDALWNGIQFAGHAMTQSAVTKYPVLAYYSTSTGVADPTDYGFSFQITDGGSTIPVDMLFMTPENDGSDIIFGTDNAGGGRTESMRITHDKEVGIGTVTEPDGQLEVNAQTGNPAAIFDGNDTDEILKGRSSAEVDKFVFAADGALTAKDEEHIDADAHTLTCLEMSGTILNNDGATADAIWTVPDVDTCNGIDFAFIATEELAADVDIFLDANAANAFYLNGVAGTAGQYLCLEGTAGTEEMSAIGCLGVTNDGGVDLSCYSAGPGTWHLDDGDSGTPECDGL